MHIASATMPYKDREKRLEYARQMYLKHRVTYSDYGKRYREDNKERLQEEKRAYYQDNKERIKSNNRICRNRRRRMSKRQAIEYKGGRCELCGYDRCRAAMCFHHLDRTAKDPR